MNGGNYFSPASDKMWESISATYYIIIRFCECCKVLQRVQSVFKLKLWDYYFFFISSSYVKCSWNLVWYGVQCVEVCWIIYAELSWMCMCRMHDSECINASLFNAFEIKSTMSAVILMVLILFQSSTPCSTDVFYV